MSGDVWDHLSDEERMQFWENLNNPAWFAENAPLKILHKERGELFDFKYNSAQRYVAARQKALRATGRPLRQLIAKARQMGISTKEVSDLVHIAQTRELVHCEYLIHDLKPAAALWKKADIMARHIDPDLRVVKSGEKKGRELEFENGSTVAFTSVNKSGVARSETIRHLRCTEHPSWQDPETLLTGIIPAIPQTPDTSIVHETTAEGIGDWWHREVERARKNEGPYDLTFLPWFIMDDYARKPHRLELKREPLTPDEEKLGKFILSQLPAYGQSATPEKIVAKLMFRRDMVQLLGYEKFQQEYPATIDEMFLASGRPFFPRQSVNFHRTRQEAEKPVICDPSWRMTIRQIGNGGDGKRSYKWVEDEKGPLQVWEMPTGEGRYIISADPSSGEAADYSAAHVLKIDGAKVEQVAVWHGKVASKEFAYILAFIGYKYNKALLVPERTGIRNVVEILNDDIRYKNLYSFRSRDQQTNQESTKFGFDTTSATRPAILEALYDLLTTTELVLHHDETVKEIQQFAYPEKGNKGKPQAPDGAHDDLVMSLAIGVYVRQDAAPQKIGIVKRKNGPKYTTAA